MKVLILIQCTNLGGMEKSALLTTRELQALGHTVEWLSLQKLGQLAPILAAHRIPVSGMGYGGLLGWKAYRPLRSALKRANADALIMVGHNALAMLALGNYCVRRRLLSMHHFHLGSRSPWVWRLIYLMAAYRFRTVVFASRFILGEALSLAPWLKKRKLVVSFPLELPPLPSEAQRAATRQQFLEQLNLPATAKVVGNAGWLVGGKRWDLFLQAASRISQAVPNAVFLVAGDGPLLGELRALANALGLTGKVHWLGWREDLAVFYQTLDVMLFLSDADAVGRTPLEAMSYGVPVVASVLRGGLGEFIEPQSGCFFLNDHDVKKLAAETTGLLTDSERARQLGRQARSHIEKVANPLCQTQTLLELLTDSSDS